MINAAEIKPIKGSYQENHRTNKRIHPKLLSFK